MVTISCWYNFTFSRNGCLNFEHFSANTYQASKIYYLGLAQTLIYKEKLKEEEKNIYIVPKNMSCFLLIFVNLDVCISKYIQNETNPSNLDLTTFDIDKTLTVKLIYSKQYHNILPLNVPNAAKSLCVLSWTKVGIYLKQCHVQS